MNLENRVKALRKEEPGYAVWLYYLSAVLNTHKSIVDIKGSHIPEAFDTPENAIHFFGDLLGEDYIRKVFRGRKK